MSRAQLIYFMNRHWVVALMLTCCVGGGDKTKRGSLWSSSRRGRPKASKCAWEVEKVKTNVKQREEKAKERMNRSTMSIIATKHFFYEKYQDFDIASLCKAKH